MKPSSAKAKGRLLQQWVRDKLLNLFQDLTNEDIRSTGMGQQGEDIQLSTAAAKRIGLSIECKSRDRIAVYGFLEQAQANCPKEREPIAVVKQNRGRPLVVCDAEYFFDLLKKAKDES